MSGGFFPSSLHKLAEVLICGRQLVAHLHGVMVYFGHPLWTRGCCAVVGAGFSDMVRAVWIGQEGVRRLWLTRL